MKILFLDDELYRHEKVLKRVGGYHSSVYRAFDRPQAELMLTDEGPFDVAFLDHDLGGRVFVDSAEENTGYQVAKFIAAQEPHWRPKRVIVHSFNAAGAHNMVQALIKADVQAYYRPFGTLLFWREMDNALADERTRGPIAA